MIFAGETPGLVGYYDSVIRKRCCVAHARRRRSRRSRAKVYGVMTVASESLGSAYRLTNEGVAQLVAISDSASTTGTSVAAYIAPSSERLTRLQAMIHHDTSKS